ncbi:DUF6444 domain-containing protein, partial [Aeromonas caviae]|uniref:DUF6444 domain-containing protein n=1 Tax=Aeromonas caviae TaxID=648 RepID=UPI001CC7C53E
MDWIGHTEYSETRIEQLDHIFNLIGINQHSGNSSKPPSSDGPGAPPPARKRPASGKQRGAQP